MQRVGLINIIIGFALVFLAACGGAFVAVDTTYRFLEGQHAAGWAQVLQTSSHGHTSLFGLIHIAVGLTMPYSRLTSPQKAVQTLLLSGGALAMGPGMLLRASYGPTSSFEWNGMIIGGLLSAALLSILLHIVGLAIKLFERSDSR